MLCARAVCSCRFFFGCLRVCLFYYVTSVVFSSSHHAKYTATPRTPTAPASRSSAVAASPVLSSPASSVNASMLDSSFNGGDDDDALLAYASALDKTSTVSVKQQPTVRVGFFFAVIYCA